jgi:hypothetical protein
MRLRFRRLICRYDRYGLGYLTCSMRSRKLTYRKLVLVECWERNSRSSCCSSVVWD